MIDQIETEMEKLCEDRTQRIIGAVTDRYLEVMSYANEPVVSEQVLLRALRRGSRVSVRQLLTDINLELAPAIAQKDLKAAKTNFVEAVTTRLINYDKA